MSTATRNPIRAAGLNLALPVNKVQPGSWTGTPFKMVAAYRAGWKDARLGRSLRDYSPDHAIQCRYEFGRQVWAERGHCRDRSIALAQQRSEGVQFMLDRMQAQAGVERLPQ